MINLSVVISPTGRDPSGIWPLEQLRGALDSLGVVYEYIDTSTGESSPSRSGHHQASLSAAAERASGKYVLFACHGISSEHEVQAVWRAARDAEVVVGYPQTAQPRDRSQQGPRSWLSRILGLSVRDPLSPILLCRTDALSEIASAVVSPATALDIVVRAHMQGWRIAEVPLAEPHSAAIHAIPVTPLLAALRRSWRLRNSVDSADYDGRAYDSAIPLQRWWQRSRHDLVLSFVPGGSSVLDIGCGSSRILDSLEHAVGLDIQPNKLRYVRRYGHPLVRADVRDLPFGDASFDCVVCSEVIEHLPRDQRIFSEMARVLRRGGRLILGTPDYGTISWPLIERLYGLVAPNAYADEHVTHYTRGDLAGILAKIGFQLEQSAYVFRSELILLLRRASTG